MSKISPVKIFIPADKRVNNQLYLYNYVKDIVAKGHTPAEFRNDGINVSFSCKKQVNHVLEGLKKFGIKFIEK